MEVAFALINIEGLEQISRTRIARESQPMGRLDSHPHIGNVFDLGEHPSAGSGLASQSYMATELLAAAMWRGLRAQNALEKAINIRKETSGSSRREPGPRTRQPVLGGVVSSLG